MYIYVHIYLYILYLYINIQDSDFTSIFESEFILNTASFLFAYDILSLKAISISSKLAPYQRWNN